VLWHGLVPGNYTGHRAYPDDAGHTKMSYMIIGWPESENGIEIWKDIELATDAIKLAREYKQSVLIPMPHSDVFPLTFMNGELT
jgi:hypothetical protein